MVLKWNYSNKHILKVLTGNQLYLFVFVLCKASRYNAVADLCFWLSVSVQVDSECTKAEQWLRERSQLQESLPKNVDPALWSHEIKKKEHELDM